MDALESLQREHLLLKWMVADLKLDLLRREFARKGGYNEEQPRDELGRWTDGGGGEAIDLSSAKRGKPGGGLGKDVMNWTVRQFISRHCTGGINRKLPSQFENVTIADLLKLRKGGDDAADTCYKLLNEPRFRKK